MEINKEMCAVCKCNDCDKEIKQNLNGQIVGRKCTANCDMCGFEQIICAGCFIKDGYNSGEQINQNIHVQFHRG